MSKELELYNSILEKTKAGKLKWGFEFVGSYDTYDYLPTVCISKGETIALKFDYKCEKLFVYAENVVLDDLPQNWRDTLSDAIEENWKNKNRAKYNKALEMGMNI